MSKPLKGVGYELNSTNKGFSLSIDEPAYVEPGDGFGIIVTPPTFPTPDIPYLPLPQFQCFAVPGAVGSAYEGNTILTIVAGGVNYTNSNMPYIAEGVEQNFAQAFITKAAVVSTGITAVAGAVPTTSLAPFMLNNGFYALLNPANKYYVVLSYYDADGDPSALDVPILAERRPWISILQEGCTEFNKIFIEQGPSYYTGLLNIAPMTEYDDAGSPKKFFGFNHTGYFNPTKFGANVKIIAMIEDGLVTQYTHGGQNLTIPVHNHGTRMMYVPGMLEIDDPYYANEGDGWSGVVNKTDITNLASLSYTGGWWDQVTDNANPVAVTSHNYSYYSVSTENTDNMGEFSCSVLGWPGETTSHRLRIKSGLVTFLNVGAASNYGTFDGTFNLYNLRINKPNIYPEDSLHIGLNDNPDYMHNDGYVELEEGEDYYVFLFKVTPDWDDWDESKAPQLVISKVGDSPNTDIKNSANTPSLIVYKYYWGDALTDPEDPDSGVPVYEPWNTGFNAPSCYRKDIAYIKWDSENDKFIVQQLHNGPVIIEDKPPITQIRKWDDEGSIGWEQSNEPIGFLTLNIVDGTYTGYTKLLNDGTHNQNNGSTDATYYLSKQPSQIESPDIT